MNEWRRECQCKEEELAKARAIEQNVMALFNQAGERAGSKQQTQAQLPFRPSMSTDRREYEMQEATPPTPTSAQPFDSQNAETQGSFASQTSSTDSRSGPTPKRAKPQRSVPAAVGPHLSMASTRTTRLSLRNQSTVKRQPLSNISANPSSRKSCGTKTPSKSGAAMEDLEESTFDGSELFAGTQGGHILGLGDALNE
jgi:hypothetical protein